ncbi:alpha/beta hydrolase [Streptomyces sp. NBC_00237]|uniref:alpha/beta fold hydrolase n=1 Tax=Streptomyces sp. NBC_00237 TaxID=2975687 RepID=UPI00225A3CE6|nr:alpha/beta hydrolase [Streptomyces sp. NBC_00237]MCX5206178.1 alpha/beta hydrolase [Streptomyces sp. NBC_00237]
MAHFTTEDGTRLYYKDWGPRTGTPVVFTHSWSLSSEMWNYQMAHLAEQGLRCIAYDRRGHGRSEQPWEGYDFDTLADDLASLMDHLDLTDVTLVGHSTGTGEVARYLTRHGSARVGKAVLVSTLTPLLRQSADYPEGVPGSVFDDMRAQIGKDIPGWVDAIAGPFFGEGTPGVTVSKALVDWSVWDTRPVSVRAMLELSRTMSETDFREELTGITVPTLVVHGGADAFNPVDLCGRGTAKLIPGSVLKVYENGPHGLHLTHMDQLNADLLEFATAPAK